LALTRAKKEELVKGLNERFSRAVLVSLVEFPGLTVGEANELRAKLRDVNGEFKVAKNTLMKIAIKGTDCELLDDMLTGPNAVVLAYEDPVAVAKVLIEFAEDHEVLKLKSGLLNGKVMDAEGLKALAKLPSREILLAQLLSVMAATPTGLVQALSGIPRKLLYALRAIEEQKQ